MMSRLRHARTLADDRAPERHIDRHASVGVTVERAVSPPPLYWRLIDPVYNLIEIGVETYTGRLVSFDLVQYNGPLHPLRPTGGGGDDGADLDGLPAFDLGPWREARADFAKDPTLHDVSGRCRCEFGDDRFRVVLFPDPVRRRVTTRGQLVTEFNADGELCALTLLNLDADERNRLAEVFPQAHTYREGGEADYRLAPLAPSYCSPGRTLGRSVLTSRGGRACTARGRGPRVTGSSRRR